MVSTSWLGRKGVVTTPLRDLHRNPLQSVVSCRAGVGNTRPVGSREGGEGAVELQLGGSGSAEWSLRAKGERSSAGQGVHEGGGIGTCPLACSPCCLVAAAGGVLMPGTGTGWCLPYRRGSAPLPAAPALAAREAPHWSLPLPPLLAAQVFALGWEWREPRLLLPSGQCGLEVRGKREPWA